MHPHLPAETFYPKQVVIDMLFVLLVMGVLGTLGICSGKAWPCGSPIQQQLPAASRVVLPSFLRMAEILGRRKNCYRGRCYPRNPYRAGLPLAVFRSEPRTRPWKRPIPVGSVLIVLIGLIGLGLQSRLDDSRDPTTASQIAQQTGGRPILPCSFSTLFSLFDFWRNCSPSA